MVPLVTPSMCANCNRPMTMQRTIPSQAGLPAVTIWTCSYCHLTEFQYAKDDE